MHRKQRLWTMHGQRVVREFRADSAPACRAQAAAHALEARQLGYVVASESWTKRPGEDVLEVTYEPAVRSARASPTARMSWIGPWLVLLALAVGGGSIGAWALTRGSPTAAATPEATDPGVLYSFTGNDERSSAPFSAPAHWTITLHSHCFSAADAVSVSAVSAARTIVTLRSTGTDGSASRDVAVAGTMVLKVHNEGCTWDAVAHL